MVLILLPFVFDLQKVETYTTGDVKIIKILDILIMGANIFQRGELAKRIPSKICEKAIKHQEKKEAKLLYHK